MKQTKNKKYFHAFTLVELIIVITILAVLATIAFVSFSNYTKSARDSSRLSTLTNVEKGLDIYFVQVGNLPTPSNPQTFTGGTNGNLSIKQGTLTKDVLQTLDKTPVDPVSGTQYTYSVFGNGKYYQVAGNLENNISKNLIQDTYADFKTTKLVGNYTYDPSLPSLIIGSGTNIFSPNTCFITNGGTDTLDNCTTKKSDLAGKTSDLSLVGYWDMETTFSSGGTTYLKDLSGNGIDGYASGLVLPTSTGGSVGEGYLFSSGFFHFPGYGNGNPKFSKVLTIDYIGKGVDGTVISKRGYNTDFQLFWETKNIDGVLNAKSLRFHSSNLNNIWAQKFASKESLEYLQNNAKVTVVYDTGKMAMYVNGIRVNSYDFLETNGQYFDSLFQGTGALQMGARNSVSYFNGFIDEFKVYNRALTDEEIFQQAKIAGF